MKNNRTIAVLRFLWIPISALFFYRVLQPVADVINSIAFVFSEGSSYEVWVRFDTIEAVVLAATLSVVCFHFIAEVISSFTSLDLGRRLLLHLRYGPVAVFLIFLATVPLFDLAMIEVSRYQIRSYIFQASESLAEPDIQPHNNYRHWCGNGVSATEEYLYFDTAAAGIDDEDPYVRARSLMMTAQVRDFFNGPDPRFKKYVKDACGDTHHVVVATAQDLLSQSNLSCSRADLIR